MKTHSFSKLFLLLLLVVGLLSCNSDAGQKYRIGVSQCSSDAWRTKLNEEMERELLFHPGITLEVRSAEDNNDRQKEDIEYFIEQGVDLLVVSPNQADVLESTVSKAFDSGIPVIVADRNVNGNKYTAFVGGDNLAVGRLMAQYLKMHLPDGGKVLEVMGLAGSTPAELRHEGFISLLGDDIERYELLQCTGNWFRDQAEQAVEQVLREHDDIAMILAQNDLMAIGARQALDRLQPDRNVIIMGVDGLTGAGNGVEAIAEGRVDASAVYATGGDLIIQTAVKILEGQPFERNTNLATYLIDAETAPLMNNIYKEVDHQVETVHMLKSRVDYFWQQHNLEQTLLYTLLGIVALIIVFVIVLYHNYNQKQRLSESLARQKEMLKGQRDQLAQQNERLTQLSKELEEATRAKLLFFTNVSHDFRTPLTLINGPLEQLIKDNNLLTADNRQQLLRLAHKNVQVLLRLVNQILDFRKYESGKLELNLSNVDMREAVQGWYESFQGLAHQKHIRLSLAIDGEGENAFQTKADLAKVERIFFNLMGNAFKFTPENGRISVSLSRACDNITMCIADTGPGISVEHIQHIFENFYQVDAAHHEGSGIGLALVKSFVELHGGTISVANQSEGTGSIFTVQIPVVAIPADEFPSVDHALAQGAASLPVRDLKTQVDTELADALEVSEEISEEEPRPIVLVIDDNQDIRSYMQSLLGMQYRVVTASHGQEGIRKAMTMMPDVIICDVMMPGMDGIECCSRLKHEVNTCHIPVMMLTACSLDEQRVQGLTEGGADAYMAKPFNADVLRAQISSLIQNHDRVRDFFRDGMLNTQRQNDVEPHIVEHTPSPSVADAAGSKNNSIGLDDKFLQRVRQSIEQHLSDESFGVEALGDEIGMSRAQLYRKCKALTNYSPVELIRNTRLKRAQQMLAQGDETIAQVAYQVGFTAPSYFTKCYKEYFGENPIELVKRKG